MAAQLTEKKKVKIKRKICQYPIYLRWLQSDGGYAYWLFSQRKTLSFRTSNQRVFFPFISDIEDARSIMKVQDKSSVNRALLFADGLTENEALGMRGLYESIEVMALINPDSWQIEGAKWQQIAIDIGTFEIGDTGRSLYQTSFNITLQPNIGITI